jgi:hypothetical protein
MRGLDPRIQLSSKVIPRKKLDGRIKSGHDAASDVHLLSSNDAVGDDALQHPTPSCLRLSRVSTSLRLRCKQDVDGRDKPGHDAECAAHLLVSNDAVGDDALLHIQRHTRATGAKRRLVQ